MYIAMHLYCEHTYVKQGIKIVSDLIQLCTTIKQALLRDKLSTLLPNNLITLLGSV